MLARKVELDFTEAKFLWAPDQPEFCHMLNAISSFLHFLEPFLIKNVRRSVKQLPADVDRALVADSKIFCAQEGWHSKLHASFNDTLAERHYPWIRGAAEKMGDDFDHFLADKSARWCMAYSEGFETFGPIVSQFFFEKAGDVLHDWHEPTVYLWLWHFAEEYEHRSVCNQLYKSVYADNYPARVYGMWFAMLHQFYYAVKVANKMINDDLAAGRIQDTRLRSKLRFANVVRRIFSFMLPKLVFRCMRPSYDPASIPPPRNSMAFLADASKRYAVRKPAE